MIVVDVNLLLYSTIDAYDEHTRAHAWWQAALNASEVVALSHVSIVGFMRISTNARIYVTPLSVQEAAGHVRDWLDRSNTTILLPGPGHFDLTFDLLQRAGTGGNLTTDAQLAALAIEHQATLHSNDSDFGKFPGLRWVNPLS